MPLFSKKPVVIRAVQFDGQNYNEIQEHIGIAEFFRPTLVPGNREVAEVYDDIHRSWIGVRVGDWIIVGIQGEAYPCDPDVFTDTYEPV